MRVSALTHSGPDGSGPQALTHHSLRLWSRTSTYLANNYYFNNTWTGSRGLDRVVVNASNLAGTGTATSSATGVVQAVPPANTALPAIAGTAQDEDILSASTGTWSGSTPLTYTYLWKDCNSSGTGCTPISGATGNTYTVQSSDIGDTIVVAVTASNSSLPGGGSATAASPATAVVQSAPPVNTVLPSVSGIDQVPDVLTASPGTWKGTAPI